MNMDTKICRICGKLSENYVHIFKTEGLKNKIETCLPIIVSPHCLLPDTICSDCLENVDNFYSFIKNCLQNIIVLEAQYDIMESCLKTKRKHEKSCYTECLTMRYDKNVQTDEDFTDLLLNKEDNFNQSILHFNYLEMEKLSAALLNAENILNGKDSLIPATNKNINLSYALVSYDIESEAESEDDEKNIGQVVLIPKNHTKKKKVQTRYFDDRKSDLINEITQRKYLKRKCDTPLANHSKIFKMDGNRRKNKQPKKLESTSIFTENLNALEEYTEEDKLTVMQQVEKEISNTMPQLCLLCDLQFAGPSMLAAHIYEMHGIDMAQVVSSEPVLERKKKIPNLVKITDLKKTEQDVVKEENSTVVCPTCLSVLPNRSDLFIHLKENHPKHAMFLCGLCLQVASSFANLTTHLEMCKVQHRINSKFICKICAYHDDNSKVVENHVPVHEFVLEFCKKQAKMFDPCDYVEINKNVEHVKVLTCTECNQSGFVTFKEFSMHRRSQHQIFHCDLCNKFYGRNSHLWKHVNRVHKGHPSITCQLCYKTSASKYHLAQHFNKIHSAKPLKQKQEIEGNDFMNQKFEGFDFQSVRQSFIRQEMMQQEKTGTPVSDDLNTDGEDDDKEEMQVSIKSEVKSEIDIDCLDLEMYAGEIDDLDVKIPIDHEQKKVEASVALPKEIDSSSDLYTNIITNYTPPQNEGEYKCPKCFKGFHKKTLLKKHKKNCRPRLQKDLLTRCKTCSRIFKDRQSLTKHLINYHSEYTCEICGQKVQSKCEIVSHIRFSHPNCHLFCHCGNILRSQVDLVEHKKDHRNSFVCQFCADMLPTKIKLKMHILSLHRKILSLSCGICLKLFETQHILRDHVCLVHKEELLPLTSCTVCGKNYGSKWKTYDHLNKSHGRIFKACKTCLEVFDNDQQLQQHFEVMHASHTQAKTVTAPSIQNSHTYESDVEPNKEENGEKNSSSEASNDAKNYNMSEEDEILPSNFPDLSLVESNRISLLEKRLMGNKKAAEEDIPNLLMSSIAHSKKLIRSLESSTPVKPKEKKLKIDALAKKTEWDSDANQHNPLQNSSKRTVYVNSNDPSLCEICLKTWPAKKHLWQHYIRCHKTVAATVCGICLKTNEDYKSLQVHLQENHPTLLHGQGFGSNFICRICGRYHNASSKLRLHMAIHENFDWSILDNAGDNQKNYETQDKKAQMSNGYVEELENLYNKSESINYESLIEQVECSSDSETNENLNSSSDDSDSESVLSVNDGNSLETQMLHNMLNEKFVTELKKEEIKTEYSSSESEGSDSNDSTSDSDAEIIKTSDESSQFSHTSKGSQIESKGTLIFARKSDELDSAIRSISFEAIGEVNEPVVVDMCDIHPQLLNQHEIQSAVDSIL